MNLAGNWSYKNLYIAYNTKKAMEITNSITPVIIGLPYATPRKLAKICGELFSTKLDVGDAT